MDTKDSLSEQEAIQRRYFSAVWLLMTGKRDEAVTEFKELADLGSDMAKKRLLEMESVPEQMEVAEKNEMTNDGDVILHNLDSTNEVDTDNFSAEAEYALHKMLSKGQSKRVKDMEDNIRIKNIQNRPVIYVAADAYYEHREIYETKEPSVYVNSTSGSIKSRLDYDLWNIEDCVKPSHVFGEQHENIRLMDSLYLENCSTCGCCGTVPCPNCVNGTETCPDCNGYGNLRCGYCGGSGEIQCSSCYGNGYTEQEEQVGNDQNNSPIYARVRRTCSTCGGNGRLTCGNCGGSGSVRCGSCCGSGIITCRVCGGTTRVTCPSCTGKGYFLNAVNVKQDFDTAVSYKITTPYQVRQSIYGTKAFASFEPNEKDICLSSMTDKQMIPKTECLAVFDGATYDMTELMQEAKIRAGAEGSTRVLNYRSRVCLRNVLDITYEFDCREYNMLLDTVTGQMLVDVNPYEHVADSMIVEMEEMKLKGCYKTFLASYKEFRAITDSEDVKHSITDVISMFNVIEKKLMMVSGITALLIYALPLLPRLRYVLRFPSVLIDILFFAAAICLPVFLTKKFWQKIAQDKGKITEILIGTLSAVIAIVLFHIRY